MSDTTIRPCLEGWAWLRELHESIFARPEMSEAIITVTHSQDLPFTSQQGGSIDLKAGTSVWWNVPGMTEDAIDHVWEARRLDRRAAAIRGLHPSRIPFDGQCAEECNTILTAKGISSYTSRHDGDDADSTIELAQERGPDGWTARLEVSWAADMPMVDLASLSTTDGDTGIAQRRWDAGGHRVVEIRYDADNADIVAVLPIEAYEVIAAVEE